MPRRREPAAKMFTGRGISMRPAFIPVTLGHPAMPVPLPRMTKRMLVQVRFLRNYGSVTNTSMKSPVTHADGRVAVAVFLRVKLRHLHEWNAYRQQVAGWYRELLADAGDLKLPAVHADCSHVPSFVVRTQSRDALQQFYRKRVGTLIHHPVPPHLQQAYRSWLPERGLPHSRNAGFHLPEPACLPGITAEECGCVDCIVVFRGGERVNGQW